MRRRINERRQTRTRGRARTRTRAFRAGEMGTNLQPSALAELAPGMTVTDVARGTGLSLSGVSRILNGRRTPSLPTASRIAAYLGVGIDRLFAVLTKHKEQ